MRIKTKTVYYCDYCSERRFRREAMAKHECHCTMNPGRTCRWAQLEYGPRTRYGAHSFRRGLPRWVRLRAPLVEADLDKLRDHVGGCPACMLAALRQSGVEYHYDAETHNHMFDYQEEVKEYREREQIVLQQDEYDDLVYSWL